MHYMHFFRQSSAEKKKKERKKKRVKANENFLTTIIPNFLYVQRKLIIRVDVSCFILKGTIPKNNLTCRKLAHA